MATGIITKTCRVCKEIKPLSEFHKKPTSKDGYEHRCKICRSKYEKQHRQTEKGKAAYRKGWAKYDVSEKGKAYRKHFHQSEKGRISQHKANLRYRKSEKGKAYYKQYYAQHPKYIKAKNAVSTAVRYGKIPRPNTLQCSCGEQAEQYHHHKGYEPEHWLDVVPVCIKCHKRLNRHQRLSFHSL